MKNTRIALLCLFLASFVGAKTAVADPIDTLVKNINASAGEWLNGIVPRISLPPDAKPNEVIAEAVKQYGSSNLPEGFIKNYQIREVRQVLETYSAALVQSDFGTYVWLFRPLKDNQWWVRFYAVSNDELRDPTVPKVIGSGEWSKPVVDDGGYALRGRLLVCEKPRSDDRREVVVYVELQDATEFGRSMLLYCDMGKIDSRPEHESGLQCELKDKDGQPVKSTPVRFGGGVPLSQWVTLPSDATIRLRATPFALYRSKTMAISPHLHSLWVIEDDDPNEYSLSGTFTIDPPDKKNPPGDEHVWKGTLDLPSVRIVNQLR